MATLRKRGDRWHVQVRRKGHKSLTHSFCRKEDALAWARSMETAIDRKALPGDQSAIEGKTLADLLQKYLKEVTPKKRGHKIETICITAFMRLDVAKKKLTEITPADFASLRDERLQAIQASTFNRQISMIQSAYEIAIREWDWPLKENPLKRIRKPKAEPSRNRRVQPEEMNRLMEEIKKTRNPLLKPVFLFAIETGMRQGEILRAEWSHLNREKRTLFIPLTKNGEPRTIPLSSVALAILADLTPTGTRIFPTTQEAIKQAWQHLTQRAGIQDLHFHDLRHEAVSRFFERGLSVPEVALISGHKDYRMLYRYTHLKAEDLAAKLH